MNIKKLVSAVSALTIAASAFAGLAVTANAADLVERDFVGSSTAAETFDSCDGTGWASTAAAFNSAASGNTHFGIVSYTEVAKPEVDASYDTTGSYPTYVSGNALDTQVRGKTAAKTTLPMTATIDNGKLYFETDVYSHATYNQPGPKFCFYNSEGTLVAYIQVDYADSAYIRLYNGSDDQLDRTKEAMTFKGSYNPGIGYHVGAVLDIDNDKITLTGDIINTAGVRTTTMNSGAAKSCTISDIAKVTIEFTGPASSNNFGVAVDNMKLYAMVTPEPAGALTVNYVDANGNSIAEGTSVDVAGKSSGDNVSYTYSKYIVNNGTLYLSDVTNTFKAETSLTAGAKSVNVTYTAQGTGTYQFVEYDGGYTTRATTSNGSAGAANGGIIVEVAADGIYTVTANGYGGAANRSLAIYKGETAAEENLLASEKLSIYEGGTDVKATGVVLKAGDKIYIKGSASTAYLDYVLLTKTADIPTASATAQGEDITVGSDAASVWSATITGVEGVAFTKVKATAKAGDSTGTGSAALPAAFEGGLSAKIIVVVPKASANITSVTVTLE